VKTVLIVEDDADLRGLIKLHLERAGHRVVESEGLEGSLPRELKPDLAILDWMLPGASGIELLEGLRARPDTARVPVILLTAKASEADIVRGLEAGADDYVTKPFSPKVLMARVAALFRRFEARSPAAPNVLGYDGLTLDPEGQKVLKDGTEISLTVYEFEVLRALLERPGKVFTRRQLLEGAKGQEVHVVERTIDNHVLGLRKKLGEWGAYIETIRGVGYRLKGDASEAG
jgi:two-component system phosphate regulon response regulator PhoB